jgi:hypothetical protein
MNKIKISFIYVFTSFIVSYGQTLVHYWNFNQSSVANAIIPSLSLTSPAASLSYTLGVSGQSTGIEMATNTAFTNDNRNARNGDQALQHLRINNNVGSIITFHVPTVGYENPIFKFIHARTNQGGAIHVVEYSINGTNFIRKDSIEITNTNINLYTYSFINEPLVNNNPNFKIRIRILATPSGLQDNTSGNHRFDNVTLDATPLSSNDIAPPIATIVPANNSINVSRTANIQINFNEKVRLVSGNTFQNAFIFKKNNINGANVSFNATFTNDSSIIVTPTSLLEYGTLYYFEINSNTIEDYSGNQLTVKTFISFRTISETTSLPAGSIVPVAIQTNTSPSSPDKVAFLFLTDVSQGTAIQVTDAKYTSNTGQCSGGFTWFAPEGGVKAGEVVIFNTENPVSATAGSIMGSGFGLSSGGEQVFLYMGTHTTPNYITAISTNAWLPTHATHTNCGGSFSLRPPQLSDTSSIELVTGTGNIVNAYYNGTVDLNSFSLQSIRSSILNRQNWISAPSGPAQMWPNWSLAGPVAVVNYSLISSNQLRIIFNKDLNATTATDLTNYSGVSGLLSATVSNNGVWADTVILTFSSLADGVENTLTVSGIKASNGIEMATNEVLRFTYIAKPKATLGSNFRVMREGESTTLTINLTKIASGNVTLNLKGFPFSTALPSDHNFASQIISFVNENSKTILINALDDNLIENDEYFVLELQGSENIDVEGFKYVTLFIKDNDKKAPVATKEIELEHVISFDPSPSASTTEAIAYDPTTKKLYAISAVQNRLDVIDFSDPSNPVTINSIDMSPYGGITSVAVKNGLVAVGSPANPQTLPGKVVFFNSNGNYIKDVTVGVLPDMVAFTPDGTKVLTADEGEPDNYTATGTDPEGSVSIINVSGGPSTIDQSKVKTISLQHLNANEAFYLSQGVRKTYKNTTLSKDLEPEYITFSEDSKKAWVICQENNAFLVINLERDTLEGIWALGTKDYSLPGNGADMATAGATQNHVLIANWPIKGYYQPDAIKTYVVNGKTYLVTANEGDEKEYNGFNERITVGASSVILDSVKFPHREILKQNYALGGFRISNIKEYADPDDDGDYDELYCVGTRSFSIFDTETRSLVYDSGDEFDYITSQDPIYGVLFNASHDNNTFKARSITKGCEPEGLDIAKINDKYFAFICFERIGGVAVYNITNPQNPVFVDYKNTRTLPPTLGGDRGPEYVVYIDAQDSPDGKYYVLVSNEISGTITVYRIKGSILAEKNETLQSKNDLYIYPNPAKSIVKLSQERKISIWDVAGILKYEGVTKEVNLENFAKGVYILKTNLGEIKKLVVE